MTTFSISLIEFQKSKRGTNMTRITDSQSDPFDLTCVKENGESYGLQRTTYCHLDMCNFDLTFINVLLIKTAHVAYPFKWSRCAYFPLIWTLTMVDLKGLSGAFSSSSNCLFALDWASSPLITLRRKWDAKKKSSEVWKQYGLALMHKENEIKCISLF